MKNIHKELILFYRLFYNAYRVTGELLYFVNITICIEEIHVIIILF